MRCIWSAEKKKDFEKKKLKTFYLKIYNPIEDK